MSSSPEQAEASEDPSKLKFFPPSKPDELLVSLASRYHWHIGGRHIKETCFDLFGNETGRLTQIIPPHISPLAHRLPGDPTQNLQQLLRSNTLYPIYSLYFGIDLASQSDFATVLSRIPRRTVGLFDSKLCLSCVKGDLVDCGTPYIHRSHQIQGVRVCHKHATPLIERCPYCACPIETKEMLFSMPWQPCKCGRLLAEMVQEGEPLAEGTPALVYARFAHDLLQLSFEQSVVPAAVSEAYRHRLMQLDFSRGTNVSREKTFQALEEYYGATELSNIDLAYRNGKRNDWLRHVQGGTATVEVPISRHLLLSAFLFNSVADFSTALAVAREKLNVQPTRTRKRREQSNTTSTTQAPSIPDKSYIRRLNAAIEENAQLRIEDLWERLPGSMSRLVRNDPEVFEEMKSRLAFKAKKPAKTEPKSPKVNVRDEERAELLRQSAIRLYATNSNPRRVMTSELLRHAGLKAYTNKKDVFPSCAKVFTEYFESNWHFWARRYIWALVQVGGTSFPTALRQKSGLHSYVYSELLTFFSKLEEPKVLKEGQIITILGKYGIQRDWAGPCPDKEVKRAGRAYQRVAAESKVRVNRSPRQSKASTAEPGNSAMPSKQVKLRRKG